MKSECIKLDILMSDRTSGCRKRARPDNTGRTSCRGRWSCGSEAMGTFPGVPRRLIRKSVVCQEAKTDIIILMPFRTGTYNLRT